MTKGFCDYRPCRGCSTSLENINMTDFLFGIQTLATIILTIIPGLSLSEMHTDGDESFAGKSKFHEHLVFPEYPILASARFGREKVSSVEVQPSNAPGRIDLRFHDPLTHLFVVDPNEVTRDRRHYESGLVWSSCSSRSSIFSLSNASSSARRLVRLSRRLIS